MIGHKEQIKKAATKEEAQAVLARVQTSGQFSRSYIAKCERTFARKWEQT